MKLENFLGTGSAGSNAVLEAGTDVTARDAGDKPATVQALEKDILWRIKRAIRRHVDRENQQQVQRFGDATQGAKEVKHTVGGTLTTVTNKDDGKFTMGGTFGKKNSTTFVWLNNGGNDFDPANITKPAAGKIKLVIIAEIQDTENWGNL